jgi:phosphatase NudJ
VARKPIDTWFFALVVVRRGDSFLLVQERKHGQRWYLPAGRAEPGESLADAALRETLEETGVPVRLLGVLRLEHNPLGREARVRALFLAEPIDETPPKAHPDDESLQAAWVTLAQLDDYELRGDEVEAMLRYVAGGGAVHPLSVLRPEGAPFTR